MNHPPLVQYLLNQALLTPDQVALIARQQQILPGSLTTHLLELQLLTEDQILSALAKLHNGAVAYKADVDSIGDHLAVLFPKQFYEKYKVIPCYLNDADLYVLVDEQLPEDLASTLFRVFKLQLWPVYTTTPRFYYALERLYGTPLLARFRVLLKKCDEDLNPSPLTPASNEPATKVRPATLPLQLSIAAANLAACSDATALLQTLLTEAQRYFPFVALFRRQQNSFRLWKSTDEGTNLNRHPSLESCLAPLLQIPAQGQSHTLGPLPQDEESRELLTALGRQQAAAACVAPLLVLEKTAALCYVDNGQQPIAPGRVAALLLLLQRAAWVLEQLLLQQKKAAGKVSELASPRPSANPPEPRPAHDWAAWTQDLLAPSADLAQRAVLHLQRHFAACISSVMAQFPGPLPAELLAADAELPPFASCNALCQLLANWGQQAAPFVTRALQNPDPIVRLMATYFFASVRTADTCAILSPRLFDTEVRIRQLALHALRNAQGESGYQELIDGLSEQLFMPDAKVQVAILRIFAHLREVQVIPKLITLVDLNQKEVARTASSVLAVLTAQSFGEDKQAWQSWWQSNRHRSRSAWLQEGLNHPSETLRKVAASELAASQQTSNGHLTQNHPPLPKEAPPPEPEGLTDWSDVTQPSL